jgi:3alpha(or 20beta)-hydroxysteroid dehydrogenase
MPTTRPVEPGAASGGVVARRVDLTVAEQVDGLADWLAGRFGRLDVFVHAAAILRNRRLRELSLAEFEQTMAVNFLSAVRLTKRLLPLFDRAGGGSIINISSRAGVQGFDRETDYCAAKFALEGFSYSLALELRESNIAVNLVTPGVRIKPTSVTRAEFAAWPPERRAEYHDPAVMGDAFVYLALQRGDGVTGRRFNALELAEAVRREGWTYTPR